MTPDPNDTANPDCFGWHEALQFALENTVPQVFNIEWMIERAERSDWRGVWW